MSEYKTYAELREKFQLDGGSIDDIVDVIKEDLEWYSGVDSNGGSYDDLECPFQTFNASGLLECRYALAVDTEESEANIADETELAYVALAAHMMSQHDGNELNL